MKGFISKYIELVGGDASDWTFTLAEAPLQDNGYDCGLFVLYNAALIIRGLEPHCEDAMPLTRQAVARGLLTKEPAAIDPTPKQLHAAILALHGAPELSCPVAPAHEGPQERQGSRKGRKVPLPKVSFV